MKQEKLNLDKIPSDSERRYAHLEHLEETDLKRLLDLTLPQIERLENQKKTTGLFLEREKSQLANLIEKKLQITLELVHKEIDRLNKKLREGGSLSGKDQSRLNVLAKEKDRIIQEISSKRDIKEGKVSKKYK